MFGFLLFQSFLQNTITTQEWFQHFYCVFNGDTVTGIDVDAIGDSSVNLESVSAALDEDITALEVQDAFPSLISLMVSVDVKHHVYLLT